MSTRGTVLRGFDYALLLAPGPLTVYLAFNAGGFFVGTQATIAMLLLALLAVRTLLGGGLHLPRAPAVATLLALTLLAAWSLLSQSWSGSQARSEYVYDNVLVYALAVALMVSIRPDARGRAWAIRSLTLGGATVCLISLLTKLLPHLWPTRPDGSGIGGQRLSYPITYWNSLGLLGVMTILLCVYLSSSRREPRWLRALAAAVIPALSALVYFTFSRGAVSMGVVGLLALLLGARGRGMAFTALSAVPASVLAVVRSYGAAALAGNSPRGAAGVAQGGHVLVVVIICVAVSGLLRYLFDAPELRPMIDRVDLRPRGVVKGMLALLAVTALIALGAPNWAKLQFQGFLQRNNPATTNDLRERLTDPSANGRLQMWGVATQGLEGTWTRGFGAGSFATRWTRYRPSGYAIVNAHSLYVEELSELGVLGLALTLGAVLPLVLGSARRCRGPDGLTHAAVLAVTLTWALEAGVDWEWQVPVVTLWPMILGGLTLASARPGAPNRAASALPARREAWWAEIALRAGIFLACLALAVLPVRISASQRYLDAAESDFSVGDCANATAAAATATADAPERFEPRLILGLCEARAGHFRLAESELRAAIARDRGDWEPWYDLGVVQAYSGDASVHALVTARTLNPLDPMVRTANRLLVEQHPRNRKAVAARLSLPPV